MTNVPEIRIMKFGPQNKKEKVSPSGAESGAKSFAQEAFRVSIQHALWKFMSDNCISKETLAKKMKMDPAQIEDIFASDMNMDLRTLGKLFSKLGCVCKFTLDKE